MTLDDHELRKVSIFGGIQLDSAVLEAKNGYANEDIPILLATEL